MRVALLRRFRERLRSAGLLAAVTALAVQIGLGAAIAPSLTLQIELASVMAASETCHAAVESSRPAGKPFHHTGPECAVCPLCQAFASSALLAPSPVLLEVAVALPDGPVLVPQARAPPSRIFANAFPRGPPS